MDPLDMFGDPPRPFKSFHELLNHRTTPCPSTVSVSTDALRLSPLLPSKTWLSTPNAPFVPEIDPHPTDNSFAYKIDGMLYINEFMKWPHWYDEVEPHAFVAPGNPKLWGQVWPTQRSECCDEFAQLPPFADRNLCWDALEAEDFIAVEEGARFGVLSKTVLRRMLAGMTELDEYVPILLAGELRAIPGDEKATASRKRTSMYLVFRRRQLATSINLLATSNLSFFQIVMWWREFQRILLDLQAIVVWTLVIRPRWVNPMFNAGGGCLPIRGLVTTSPSLLETCHRIGVPVWYHRTTLSITTSTLIGRIETSIDGRLYFSKDKVTSFDEDRADAPAWYSSKLNDSGKGNVFERLKRSRLSNRPFVFPLGEYDPATVPSLEMANKLGLSSEPDHLCRPLFGASTLDAVRRDLSVEAPDGLYSTLFVIGQPKPKLTPHEEHNEIKHDDVLWTSIELDNTIQRISIKGPHLTRPHVIPVKPPSQSARPLGTARPSWYPREAPGWTAALDELGESVADDSRVQILYGLPPPHIFCSTSAPKFIHTWLRVYRWAKQQMFHPRSHGKNLMNTRQWRIVLEGNFYAPPDLGKLPEEFLPRVSLSELESLPRHPSLNSHIESRDSSAGKIVAASNTGDKRKREGEHPAREKANYATRKKWEGIRDRAEIAHRMGVVAGFEPHDPKDPCAWNGRTVTYAELENNLAIRQHVVWELSLLLFRFELFTADREICREVYEKGDSLAIANRQLQMLAVFGMDAVSDVANDELTSQHWPTRSQAVDRFAVLLVPWGLPYQATRYGDDNDVYRAFEKDVFKFYVSCFFNLQKHIPTIPLLRTN